MTVTNQAKGMNPTVEGWEGLWVYVGGREVGRRVTWP